jgi:hypothetical protein
MSSVNAASFIPPSIINNDDILIAKTSSAPSIQKPKPKTEEIITSAIIGIASIREAARELKLSSSETNKAIDHLLHTMGFPPNVFKRLKSVGLDYVIEAEAKALEYFPEMTAKNEYERGIRQNLARKDVAKVTDWMVSGITTMGFSIKEMAKFYGEDIQPNNRK